MQKLAQQRSERLALVLADAGYDGQPLAQWTREHGGWRLETAFELTGSFACTPVPPRGGRALHPLVTRGPALEPRLRMRNSRR